jgi:hypothetical protein
MPVDFTPDEKENRDAKFELGEDAMAEISVSLTKVLVEAIKDQVLNQVIPSLGPSNFRGEAITYMKQNEIPITETGIPGVKGVSEDILGVKQYSQLMFKSFISNVDALIVYDEQENVILISPFIEALEFGDFYRPVLKTITRSIEAAFEEV